MSYIIKMIFYMKFLKKKKLSNFFPECTSLAYIFPSTGYFLLSIPSDETNSSKNSDYEI